jgi:hypothetical protein
MWALAAKALPSGILVVAIAETAKRQPTFRALITSLPLIAIFGMILLWHDNPDAGNMARYSQATFWYVLPSLPMFLLIPALLRQGMGFWPALSLGCVFTASLYVAIRIVGHRLDIGL